MIQAAREQIPEATPDGCMFHFKQAIRRKLKKLRIPEDQVSLAMQPEKMDSLAVTPRSEIEERIKELRQEIEKPEVKKKWDRFYEYFRRT